MSKFARQTVLVLWVWFMLTGVCLGKQVYLLDGGIVECKSFRQAGNLVIVKINRDTVIELERKEVDLRQTLLHDRKITWHKKSKKPAVLATPVAAKAAATSAKTGPVPVKPPVATTPPAKPAAARIPDAVTKPTPAPSVAVAAKPVTVPTPVTAPAPVPSPPPAPAPVAKEPVQPDAVAKTAVEPSAPPDKAEMERRSKQAAEMMAEAIQKKDPELLKKAMELQQSTVPQESRQQARIWSIKIVLILLICSLLILVSMWVVFAKAGESGWKCLVPIYNMYILMVISGKPGWWFILLFIPLVGAAFYLMALLALAERFGRSALFGVGLFILPMFFFPLLAFGGSKTEV